MINRDFYHKNGQIQPNFNLSLFLGSKKDVKVVSHPGSGNAGSDKTPDSGIRSIRSSGTSSEDEYLDQELRQSISSSVYAALSGDTPRLFFIVYELLRSS